MFINKAHFNGGDRHGIIEFTLLNIFIGVS